MARPAPSSLVALSVAAPGGALQAVAALREAQFSETLGHVAGANPDSYGAAYPIPAELSWSASATQLLLMGETPGEQGAAYAALRAQQQGRRPVEIEARWPDGTRFTGQALVTGFSWQAALQQVMTGSYNLVGQGMLTETV